MPFSKFEFTRFFHAEDGAVTVDWVVLTAGIIGLCLIAYSTIERESVALSKAAGTAVNGRIAELPE
ncbi:hypothetical protein FIU97_03675 [Roseivivax sp. THAF40]|uniref:hypothetical protein n=1 Tax=unclassified Roseivivax TaxID=2639302 RepID=UPI001268B419|nr:MULTISPECIES: hypothetical protein [unclassified Roseivivax]QFS81867.1 hypothetical protein FIV09_03415 [Roseivivax sp. THAF197b]QFT45667.1 hypothetical protein FIU97_03675 [Roseivivax sp. THAF40]